MQQRTTTGSRRSSITETKRLSNAPSSDDDIPLASPTDARGRPRAFSTRRELCKSKHISLSLMHVHVTNHSIM
jgi:hypothetical protein